MGDPLPVRQVPLLLVDLDSTVRYGYEELGRFVHGPDDVAVFTDASVQIGAWRRAGGRCAGVSNQGGIGLGYVEESQIVAAHLKTVEVVDLHTSWGETDDETGHAMDVALYCPHAPDAGCWCRKHGTGMAHEAVIRFEEQHPDETYPTGLALFVGDRPEDAQCAARLGVRFLDAAAWRASRPHVTPEWVQGVANPGG